MVEFKVVAHGGFHLLRGVRGPDSRGSGREAVPVQIQEQVHVQVEVKVWACLARGRGLLASLLKAFNIKLWYHFRPHHSLGLAHGCRDYPASVAGSSSVMIAAIF